MEESNKDIEQKQQATFKPGEKGFAVFWLLIGLFFTWQSILLYRQSPGASSYGAVPLFCSVLIDLFAVIIIVTDRNKKSPNSGQPIITAVKNAVSFLAAHDVVVITAMVVLYCVALYMGAGFMLATPVFLWTGMTYLSRGNMLKNLIWTALCMLFIYLVFRILFSVVLP